MSRVFEIIRSKRSVRQFEQIAIPDEMVHQILDAGRLSGSAKNMQPWHFVAVTNKVTLKRLSECGEFAGHLAGAALGVAMATMNPYFRLTVPFDLGRAAQNMMLTAWAAGIGSEMATIYHNEKARELLGAPSDFVIPYCISFGYPAQTDDRPPRKSGRKPADEIVHFESW